MKALDEKSLRSLVDDRYVKGSVERVRRKYEQIVGLSKTLVTVRDTLNQTFIGNRILEKSWFFDELADFASDDVDALTYSAAMHAAYNAVNDMPEDTHYRILLERIRVDLEELAENRLTGIERGIEDALDGIRFTLVRVAHEEEDASLAIGRSLSAIDRAV